MVAELFLENLVDLHQHLGSSSNAHFLWELAHQQGIRLPEKDYWKFLTSVTIDKNTTYDNYLRYFDLTEKIQSSPYATERSTHNAVSFSYRKSAISLIELRFNPMLRNKGGEHDLDKIILGALIGIKKAMLEYPVRAGLILMMDRRFDAKKNGIIVDKAIKFKADGVVGIDVGGPINEKFSFKQIAPAISRAREAKLGITIHTGEVTSSNEIWEVLEVIEPDRIGHGIRSVDDLDLLRELSRKNVVLEICPTSNIKTSALKNLREVRSVLSKLKKFGVKYTINSDGPQLLQINVKKELINLYEHKCLTKKEIIEVTEIARNATFIR